MRAHFWVGGTILTVAAIIGWFTASGAHTAPQPKADGKNLQDDRDELANKLMELVTIDDSLKNVTVKDALEYFSEKFQLTLLVDFKSFANVGGGAVAQNAAEDDAILKGPISIPPMKNVRLATAMKSLAEEMGGVYLLYPDHIKFVSYVRAETIVRPNFKNYGNSDFNADPDPTESRDRIISAIPLLNANFNERPLQDAIREVEIRTNQNVAISSQAGDKAKIAITARFTNVPVDTAVASLAEMAGLKMARKGNVLLVTTSERAAEFDPPPVFGHGGLVPGGFGVPNPNDQVEELKKKVAELEKALADLKKEKK